MDKVPWELPLSPLLAARDTMCECLQDETHLFKSEVKICKCDKLSISIVTLLETTWKQYMKKTNISFSLQFS